MKLLRAHKGLLGLWRPQLLQRNFIGRSSLVISNNLNDFSKLINFIKQGF